MKRIAMSAIAVAIVFALTAVNAAAVTVDYDGTINRYEWNDSVSVTSFSSRNESGCNIDQGYVKYKYDRENRVLSMAFITNENSAMSEETQNAAAIKVNGYEEIVMSTGENNISNSSYDVFYGISVTGESAAIEARIIIKKITDGEINIRYCHIDSYGNRSAEREITIESEQKDQTENSDEKTSTKKSSGTTSKTANTTKTTSSKTTKAKTTKSSTVKSKTTAARSNAIENVKTHEEQSKKEVIMAQQENGEDGKKLLKIAAVCSLSTVVIAYVISNTKQREKKMNDKGNNP